MVKKGTLLTPGFDVEKILVPVGFHPSTKSFTIEKTDVKVEEEQAVVDVVVQRIVEKADIDPKDILEEIKQIEVEKNIISDVALLFIAKKYNVDVNDCFDSVEKAIFKENAK